MSKFDVALVTINGLLPAISVLMINKFSVDTISGLLAGLCLGLWAVCLVLMKFESICSKK